LHHVQLNVRIDSGGRANYRGAFTCDVKDFGSSSGYVVVTGCDRWELAGDAPKKNRGLAWLHMEPVENRNVENITENKR
jgi:hypothetical protein